jgi:hypothetical protein
MQRQKVKGTGHKQPADVHTEPNFYKMSPSKPTPPDDSSDKQISPLVESVSLTALESNDSGLDITTYADLSPGMGGVRNAAQLLKGLASGVPFSLGQAAGQGRRIPKTGTGHHSPPSIASTTIAITPSIGGPPTQLDPFALHQSSTMSLLGRVTNVRETPARVPPGTTSAFFWPPQTTTRSPIIHSSPGMESTSISEDTPSIPGLNTTALIGDEKQEEPYLEHMLSAGSSERQESIIQPRLIRKLSTTMTTASDIPGACALSTASQDATTSLAFSSPLDSLTDNDLAQRATKSRKRQSLLGNAR